MKRVDWKYWRVDLLGAGLFLTVALAGYGLFIHRPLKDALDKTSATRRLHDARAAYNSLQNTCTLQQRKVENVRKRLHENRTELLRPRVVDGFLSQLNEMARQCGMEVAKWQPAGAQEHEQFHSEGFQIEGRGSFPAVYHWMALIEAGVSFLDVTHFSIESSRKDADEMCVFKCSLMSYSASQKTKQVATARP